MQLKSSNPIKWASAGINKALNRLAQDQNSGPDPSPQPPTNLPATQPEVNITPVEEQAKDAVPVSQQEASRALASIDQREQDERMRLIIQQAGAKTDQFRKEAENFDDEKASIGEKGLRFLFTTFAYLVPVALAVLIGLAVGDSFTPIGSTLSYSAYAHFLSIALEMSLPILGFCVSLTFRRAAKDRSQVALCALFSILFIALGLGNAIVQVFMVTQNIGALTSGDKIAVIFRAGAPLVIDLICTLYLSVTGAKSLKRYLADRRAVIEAVRDVSGINILLEQQEQTAALNSMQALADMQSKQQRAVTWNKLEALQAEKMVRSAEKAMRDETGDDGYTGAYRRRRY
jgi:hypothetical protein